jgi:hypothetical protein
LVGDRERDPVLLDVGVEDLVVEQRGRLGYQICGVVVKRTQPRRECAKLTDLTQS